MLDITEESRRTAVATIDARWKAAYARRQALVDEAQSLLRSAGFLDEDEWDKASPDARRLMVFRETVDRLMKRAGELDMFDDKIPEWSAAAEEIMRLLVAFSRDGLRA